MSKVLRVVQALLAVAFLFAGSMKLILPADALAAAFPGPVLFVRFIGVAEVLGAFGLILPGLLRIRPDLTPLAAVGLVSIMTGATLVTLTTMGLTPALMPLALGLLASFVVFARRRVLPTIRRNSSTSFQAEATGVVSAAASH